MVGLGNIDDVYKHYLVVIEENQQLKELLKECRPYVDQAMPISFNDNDIGWKPWQINRCTILTKIDNAIGEK